VMAGASALSYGAANRGHGKTISRDTWTHSIQTMMLPPAQLLSTILTQV
jgi:hypothetical protein